MDSPPRRPQPRRKELFNISEFLLVTLTYTWNQYSVFLTGPCFHNRRSIRTLTTSIYSSTKISHRLVEKPTTLLTALPNTVGRASKKALQVIRAASEPKLATTSEFFLIFTLSFSAILLNPIWINHLKQRLLHMIHPGDSTWIDWQIVSIWLPR